jgi:uncharacterized protein YoxC
MVRIDDSPLELEAFDLFALRLAKKNCNAQWINVQTFHAKTNYLPEFYSRVDTLNTALNEADFYLPQAAQGICVDLKNKVKSLVFLQEELADASDDDDREEILEDLARVLSKATDQTRRETKTLTTKLQSLNTSLNRGSLLRRLEACEADAAKIPEDIAKLQEKNDALDGEYATLTSAIDAFDSTQLPQADKETILDPAALAALGLTVPQLAAVQAALELLQKALQELNATLNYLGLLALRDSLVRRINKVREDIADKLRELAQTNDRIQLIESIQGFDDERPAYTNELSTIVTSLDSFLAETANASSEDEAGEQFVRNANALIDYLSPIF